MTSSKPHATITPFYTEGVVSYEPDKNTTSELMFMLHLHGICPDKMTLAAMNQRLAGILSEGCDIVFNVLVDNDTPVYVLKVLLHIEDTPRVGTYAEIVDMIDKVFVKRELGEPNSTFESSLSFFWSAEYLYKLMKTRHLRTPRHLTCLFFYSENTIEHLASVANLIWRVDANNLCSTVMGDGKVLRVATAWDMLCLARRHEARPGKARYEPFERVLKRIQHEPYRKALPHQEKQGNENDNKAFTLLSP